MEYFTLLTQKGSEKIAAATAANTTVNLTYIALGDGKGTVPMPDASKIALVNEVYRAPLNDLRVDEQNTNWLVAEGYVPSDEGNFWVREVGVFDSDGDLIIIGNYPETFKPITSNGVAKDLYMKVITEVSSADAVTLQVDPSIVMASQEFVKSELKKYALINGNNTKKFKVANATADDEAINQKQLKEILDNKLKIDTGTFKALLWGTMGNTENGQYWEKEIEGAYQIIANRVFINFDNVISGNEYSNIICIKGIKNLPFIAKTTGTGSLYGRGIKWRWENLTSGSFIIGVFAIQDTKQIFIRAERTDTYYSGYPSFFENSTNCNISNISISYEKRD